MENQDYDDNLPRYRPNGYRQQIKREIEINDIIIKHQRYYKLEIESQLREIETRKAELENLKKKLKKKEKELQIKHNESIYKGEVTSQDETQSVEGLAELLTSTNILMDYSIEIFDLEYEIRTNKLIIRSINSQIRETKERKQKVEVAIC